MIFLSRTEREHLTENADALCTCRSTWPEDAASGIAAEEEDRDVRDCELSGVREIGCIRYNIRE